jgi:phage baseplate assembly protein W
MVNNNLERAISLPFSIDSYGNVGFATSQQKIWSDRVRSVIGTSIGERVMNSRFGTSIPQTLFATRSVMEDTITKEANKAFSVYLPLLTLVEVAVTFDDVTNTITADLTYELPNTELSTTSIGIAAIEGNKLLSEEIL